MLYTNITQEITKEFKNNLNFANKIDIASAWATCSDALEYLCHRARCRKIEVRAIIGIFGNATDPDALNKLQEIGELRIDQGNNGLFHPKIYIFHGGKQSCAWIGSANFTSGGFGKNKEAIFQTKNISTVVEWFDNQWSTLNELEEDQIEGYRKRRKTHGISRPLQQLVHHSHEEIEDEMDQNNGIINGDWSAYFSGLKARNARRYGEYGDRDILGDTRSYIHTIATGNAITRYREWENLTRRECGILLGVDKPEGVWGFLGTLEPAGRVKKIFNPERMPDVAPIRQYVHEQVQLVLEAEGEEISNIAHNAVQVIRALHGFGPAAATRLLTLARPDRLVSVNAESVVGLLELWGEYAEIDESIRTLLDQQNEDLTRQSLTRCANYLADNYSEFLNWVYQRPWFESPRPTDISEQRVWNYRSALLDAFVYNPIND